MLPERIAFATVCSDIVSVARVCQWPAWLLLRRLSSSLVTRKTIRGSASEISAISLSISSCLQFVPRRRSVTSVNLGHFRPRKAAEGAVRPPTAPRPPHTLCGHRRRRDTSPRGSAERSAPPQLSGERRGAASGSFGESPTSCTEYRGAFSAPEAFVPHAPALTSSRRAATGAQSTNPATVPPPAKLFCSVRTINLESAAERARSFGVDTHFSGASGAARLSSAAPRAVLGPQVLWRGPRSGRGVFWRVQHLVQHPTPKALLSSAP